MPEPRVIVVVPCFNEASRLALHEFSAAIDTTPCSFLFVDDGSTDGTRTVLSTFAAARPDRVFVVGYQPNRGKGEAVRHGMFAAAARGCEFVGYWDADLSTPLSAIPTFLDVLAERPSCVMVLGSRERLPGSEIDRRALRHYPGRVFAAAAAWALGLPIHDTQCGAKMFRATSEVLSWFAEPFETRWTFDIEVLARLTRSAGSPEAALARLYELPLERWTHVPGSKVKPYHLPLAFRDLWRIRRRYRG